MVNEVSIIGAGNVGSMVAYLLAKKDCVDIINLVDLEEIGLGKAEDINQASVWGGWYSDVVGTNNYEATYCSDVVVITAGLARTPDMKTRADLFKKNRAIVREVAEKANEFSPNALFIVVTNPVDKMVEEVVNVIGERERVIGMGSLLDTARFTYYLRERGWPGTGFVIGKHTEKEMLPIVGDELFKFVTYEDMKHIVKLTRTSGKRITKRVGTSAYFAPAHSVVKMIEAISLGIPVMLPCSVLRDGDTEAEGRFVVVERSGWKEGI